MSDNRTGIFIAVGSNIEPEQHISRALRLLAGGVTVRASSTFYRTAALGRGEQPRFLNGVWRIETSLSARELKFAVLREIESKLGRIRTADKCAARTIDLDILLYDDSIIRESDLYIPDPDVRTRPFLAVPLLELSPDLVMPDTGEPLAALVDPVSRTGLEAVDGITRQLRAMIVGQGRQL